jgi:hypothetical protein
LKEIKEGMLRRRFGLERAICVVHTDMLEPEEPEFDGFEAGR